MVKLKDMHSWEQLQFSFAILEDMKPSITQRNVKRYRINFEDVASGTEADEWMTGGELILYKERKAQK